jgi:L-ascorbate metabolism protein UlaG (beta-lactamase superfamily)
MTENIEVFTQSSIRITESGRTIYIDPFQMNEKPKNADYILITHDHYDHFSPEDIAKVANSNTILIVPEKMEEKTQEAADLVGRILTVKSGVYREVEGLEFETVPAYNLLKPFHPKGAEWVGYILRIDGKRIYIAGDTDETKEAKAVKCDIALIPIGGTYTMDAKKAAELVNTIRPDVAIPTHYGSIVGKPADGEVFAQHVKAPTVVELKLKF